MTLTLDQHQKARRLGISDAEMEARLDDWYARKQRRDAERPQREAEKAERALRRAAEQVERIKAQAVEAAERAERARQHECVLAERAAARAAKEQLQRKLAEADRLKQREADEQEALERRIDDGRTWDPDTGVTIERATGKPVVRTRYAFGWQYSCNPINGLPWPECPRLERP